MLMHDGPKDLLALVTNKHVVVSEKKGPFLMKLILFFRKETVTEQ